MASAVQKDQGWAWVVLAASAASLFIFVVLAASIGFFQVEIMEDLGVGAGPISIMSSLALGQSCVLGPVSGILASLLSVRVTVFLGIILYSGGLLMASFSQSLASITFFFGFLTGFGFGIAYTASVVVISLHFERHRLLANGIIMCAPGLGTLSLPYLITWAIGEHGWRWTAAMVGGYVLHIAALASVYFPTDTERQTMVDWSAWRSKLALWSRWSRRDAGTPGDVCGLHDQKACDDEMVEECQGKEGVHGCESDTARETQDKDGFDETCKSSKDDARWLDTYSVNCADVQCSQDNAHRINLENKETSADQPHKGNRDKNNHLNGLVAVTDNRTVNPHKNLAISFKEFLSREDIRSFKITNPNHILKLRGGFLHEGSLKSLPPTLSAQDGAIKCSSSYRLQSHQKHASDLENFVKLVGSDNFVNGKLLVSEVFLNASTENVDNGKSLNGYKLRKRSSSSASDQSYRSLRPRLKLHQSQACPVSRGSGLLDRTPSWIHSQTDLMGSSLLLPIRVEEVRVQEAGEGDENEPSVKQNLKKVLRCKSVWMLCFTSFCFIFGFGMNMVHFPAFAERQGVARDGISQFYTAFGLVIMVARLSGGIMLNLFRSKPPLAIMLCVLQSFMGLFIALAPFYATTRDGLFVMQIGLAVTYGVGYMLFAPICVQILGVDLLAISFGIVQLFIGIGYISSPIIAGFLYDATGAFDVPLIMGGSVVTVGVLPLALTACVASRQTSSVASQHDVEILAEAEAEGKRMLEQQA